MDTFAVALYAALAFLGFVLSSLMIKGRRRAFIYALIPVSFFLLKCGLILLNESLQIFDAKLAGNFTLDYYQTYKVLGLEVFTGDVFRAKTFLPQLAINIIPFKLFGDSREVMLITNAILTTLAGVVAFWGMRRIFSFRVGIMAMLLINLYPAAINFSFFGLRDPIIYFGLVCNIVAFLYFFYNRSIGAFLGIIITLLIIIPSRPELVAIIFMPFGLVVLSALRRWYRSVRKFNQKVLATTAIFAFFILPTMGTFYMGYSYVVGQIGAVVNPVELLKTSSEVRYDRAMRGDAGMSKSNILPPALYKKLPWFVRWPVQTLGIIILPFPWLITSIAKVLAFADSIFLIFFFFVFRRKRKEVDPHQRLLIDAMKITFIIGVLIFGVVVINAGNAFRMRLVIAPYILIPAAIYSGLYFNKNWMFSELKGLLNRA